MNVITQSQNSFMVKVTFNTLVIIMHVQNFDRLQFDTIRAKWSSNITVWLCIIINCIHTYVPLSRGNKLSI